MTQSIVAKLVLATGSHLVRHGISAMLQSIPQLQLVESCNDAAGAEAAIRQHAPDVLIVEPALATTLLARRNDLSRMRLLLLSSSPHLGTGNRFADQIACGFVSEREHMPRIADALRTIGECRTLGVQAGCCQQCPLRNSLQHPLLPLSERESTVFEMIGRSETAGGIARTLGLSVKTIETYRENIKRKLELGSAAALAEAAFAWKRGDFLPVPQGATAAPWAAETTLSS